MGILNLIFVSVMLGLGTAGNSLADHDGHKFTTKDQDNDVAYVNCATVDVIRGAWWFYECRKSNLNGVYAIGGDGGTMKWGGIRSIKSAEMKIRPVDF